MKKIYKLSTIISINNNDSFLNKISSKILSKKYYKIIFTKADLIKFVKKLYLSKCFAFNIETDSFDTLSTNLIGFSFATEKGKSAYLPLGHNYLDAPKQLSLDEVITVIKPILVDENIQKITKNSKFNYGIMANFNIDLKNMVFDIMLESYILSNANGIKYSDKYDLTEGYFNHKIISFQDIKGKRKDQLTFNKIKLEQASNYAVKNVDLIFFLHKKLWSKLKEEPKLKQIFQQIEIPLIQVLARIERVGVLIDANKLIKQSKEISNKLIEIKKEAYDISDQEFNLESTKQLQVILFEKFQLPVINKTSSGLPSTNEETLKELAFIHKLPRIILQYRNLSKLKSTYIDKLQMMIHPKTKRVHTSYCQTSTTTGRLSSRNPNLQNIPVRTNEGRRIRQAFIARKGYKILSADYSQIELRIMAHFSQDKGLLNAFSEGKDIHKATASEVFCVLLNDVTSDQRHIAKTINFGLIYGMTAFGLSHKLRITFKEAKHYIDCYFDRYPGVLSYIQHVRKQATKQGYIETIEGRKLYLPNINSYNIIRRKASERQAINALIQGTAADIIKKTMILLDKWIETVKPDIYMLMQVHDELIFEVKESAIDFSKQKIRLFMEQSIQLTIPLKVYIGVGNNWDEAH